MMPIVYGLNVLMSQCPVFDLCLDVVCWSLARDPRAPWPEEQVDGILLRGQGEKVTLRVGDRGQIISTAPCKDMDAR